MTSQEQTPWDVPEADHAEQQVDIVDPAESDLSLSDLASISSTEAERADMIEQSLAVASAFDDEEWRR